MVQPWRNIQHIVGISEVRILRMNKGVNYSIETNFEHSCYKIRTMPKVAVYRKAYNALESGTPFVFRCNSNIGTPTLAEASCKV